MKNKFIFFLVMAPCFALKAQTISGRLDCTVTGSIVAASEDGKFKNYSGFKDGIKVGDRVTLNYSATRNSTSKYKSLYITMVSTANENKPKTVISQRFDLNDQNINLSVNPDGGLVIKEQSFNHSISFQPDYIRVKEFRELALRRYYKNDWHGIFISSDPTESLAQFLAFNCRHVEDNMELAAKLLSAK
ncbi:MAG: hypothetical protein FJY42_13050 [Betaproteobacteria bacterium]|nr:hypothetical protein [Betaproteobacteria bacterium]